MSQRNGGYDQFFKQARKQAAPGRPLKLQQTPRAQAEAARTRAGAQNSRPAPSSLGVSRQNPEKAIRELMSQRLQEKKTAQTKKRAKFPLASALILTAIIAVGGTYFLVPNSYEFIAKHVDIGFLGSAEASDTAKDAKDKNASDKSAADKDSSKKESGKEGSGGAKEKSSATDGQGGEKSSQAETKSKDGKIVDTRGWTPEEMSFFNKLNDRKGELDAREADLSKLDEELQRQKVELDKKLEQLEKMRSEISGVLKSRVALDQEKVDKLVQVYSGMKAPQAAKLIETINEDLAVEVLDKMKKKNASEILNTMDAKKAQKLSEMLAGYVRQPAASDEK